MTSTIGSIWASPKARGALSAAIGVVIAGSLFYPLLELTGGGGDVDLPLFADLVIGAIGGAWASPVAAAAGAIYGAKFGSRLTMTRCVVLVVVGAFLAAVPALLLGGLSDPGFLWVPPTLGAIAVVIGLVLFSSGAPAQRSASLT